MFIPYTKAENWDTANDPHISCVAYIKVVIARISFFPFTHMNFFVEWLRSYLCDYSCIYKYVSMYYIYLFYVFSISIVLFVWGSNMLRHIRHAYFRICLGKFDRFYRRFWPTKPLCRSVQNFSIFWIIYSSQNAESPFICKVIIIQGLGVAWLQED